MYECTCPIGKIKCPFHAISEGIYNQKELGNEYCCLGESSRIGKKTFLETRIDKISKCPKGYPMTPTNERK